LRSRLMSSTPFLRPPKQVAQTYFSRSAALLAARNQGARIAHGRSDAQVGDGGVLERYVHFGITAGSRCIDGGHNPFNVPAQSRPLLIADNHERDFPALQVLLVTQVLVSGQQKLETCRLRSGDQFAVKKPVPPSFHGFNYPMAMERLPERGGSTVIKEYEHQPLGRGGCTGSASRLRAANLITATTCSWDK